MVNRDKVLRLMRKKAQELEADNKQEFAEVLDSLADTIEEMPEETTEREKVFTKIHKGSPITYPAWKCGYCGFEDRFKQGVRCKMCGRRFSDE